jgi:hypothetical protein
MDLSRGIYKLDEKRKLIKADIIMCIPGLIPNSRSKTNFVPF